MDEQTRGWIGELLTRIESEQLSRVSDLEKQVSHLRTKLEEERDENRRLWAAMAKTQYAAGVLGQAVKVAEMEIRADLDPSAGPLVWASEVAVSELTAADKLLDGMVPLTPVG